MLDIFNKLGPFFEDSYLKVGVREYSRLIKVSPPSASKILKNFEKEGLLKSVEEKRYLCFYVNPSSKLFIRLHNFYWEIKINNSGLIDYLEKSLVSPLIILFGSFSKSEINANSDIDLAIFTSSNPKLDVEKFEKKFNRKIQLFLFKNEKEVKNKNLFRNILNGTRLNGMW